MNYELRYEPFPWERSDTPFILVFKAYDESGRARLTKLWDYRYNDDMMTESLKATRYWLKKNYPKDKFKLTQIYRP